MSFLFKTAFWLAVAIMFLPAGEGGREETQTALSASEAIHAASSAIGDMRDFCDRNRQTCEVGGEALRTFGLKAQYGAKLLYDYLDGLNEGAESRSANTLSPADREPEWRGPQQG